MEDEELDKIIRQQSDQFARWQDNVPRQLRDREMLQELPGEPILQLLILPSFEIPEAIDVFKSSSEGDYYLVRTHAGDVAKAQLSKADFEPMFKRLCSASIPGLLPSSHEGLDGTTYELWVGNFWLSWRIAWWENLPEGFGEFRTAIGELIAYLRGLAKQAKAM